MKNYNVIFFGLILLFSCKVPYSKKDVFSARADLAVDEAPHKKNSLEWWYFTGHLKDTLQDKVLGVEYVVFHVNPTKVKGAWMVNVAVSDPDRQKFYYDHEFFPKSKGQFASLPLDFSWSKKHFSSTMKGEKGEYEFAAQFGKDETQLKLSTTPEKEVVLHDGVGYESYGEVAKAGYYSFPRLATEGEIQLEGKTYQVNGDLWYDRQWNCSGVFDKKVAWDWFSIQFEETQSELMLYRLYHLENGTVLLGGTYTNAKNESIFLENDQINIQELAHWTSPDSKAKYPTEWALKIDDIGLETNLKSLFPDQELALNFGPFMKFYYWEGMCEANGSIGNQIVKGNSYVEMTNRFRINE